MPKDKLRLNLSEVHTSSKQLFTMPYVRSALRPWIVSWCLC